jgi:hypothetical protein
VVPNSEPEDTPSSLWGRWLSYEWASAREAVSLITSGRKTFSRVGVSAGEPRYVRGWTGGPSSEVSMLSVLPESRLSRDEMLEMMADLRDGGRGPRGVFTGERVRTRSMSVAVVLLDAVESCRSSPLALSSASRIFQAWRTEEMLEVPVCCAGMNSPAAV